MQLSIDPLTFNELGSFYCGEQRVSPDFEPTLHAARARLKRYHPQDYASSRNHVAGHVSRLNPYITWGVLSLKEVQRAVKAKAGGKDYHKFVNELAWKQYFRECFLTLGERVYDSLEPYKYPTKKRDELPQEIFDGKTGLACIDSIVHNLKRSGYLYNHERMWFAAYLVHYADYAWWHGEAFFYRYLLDGEPGPNALSWQWVASTFANKPYYFNSDNMAKYGHPPCRGVMFDTSYEELDRHVFSGYGRDGYAKRPKEQPRTRLGWPYPSLLRPPGDAPLILLHAERLSDSARVLRVLPDAPVLVYLDAKRFRDEKPSFMRFHFALSLAADLVRTLRVEGRKAELMLMDAPDEVTRYAQALGCKSLAAPDSWHPGTWDTLAEFDKALPARVLEDESFLPKVDASLQSFSRYWRVAEKTLHDA